MQRIAIATVTTSLLVEILVYFGQMTLTPWTGLGIALLGLAGALYLLYDSVVS